MKLSESFDMKKSLEETKALEQTIGKLTGSHNRCITRVQVDQV